MKFRRAQSGISFFILLFWIILLIMVSHTVFKLFPVYMEDMTVKSILESVVTEPDAQYRRPADVHQAIFRRFGVNNLTRVSREDVGVIRDGEYFKVNIDYKVTLPYMWNISLLVEFSHQAEVRAR